MTPEFAAYRAELRQVALPLRALGLFIVLIGCCFLVASRGLHLPNLIFVGLAVLACGWGVSGYTIWLRTQWAKQHPYTGPR